MKLIVTEKIDKDTCLELFNFKNNKTYEKGDELEIYEVLKTGYAVKIKKDFDFIPVECCIVTNK